MHLLRPKRLSLLMTLVCLGSTPAYACDASKQLSALGQSYERLLGTESPADWRRESVRLAKSLEFIDATALGRDLGVEGAPADISRIARLFADVSSLASGTWADRSRHAGRSLQNLTYIDRLLTATGCETPQKIASQSGASDRSAQGPSASEPATPDSTTPRLALWTATAVTVALIAAIAAFIVVRKGLLSAKADRLTRHHTVIPVLSTPEGAPPELIDTADISRGGVRLSWKNAPPAGTPLSIDFSELECSGQVIWSNAYFAGVRFETLLTEDELTRIRNRNNAP